MDNEVVDLLRDRLDEDLNSILKTNLGGYTKKSVQDYVLELRREQQERSRQFDTELKQVLAEKEKIQKMYEQALAQVSEKDAQYRSISETLEDYRHARMDASTEDVVDLKHQIAAGQEQVAALKSQNRLALQKAEQIKELNEQLKSELEKNAADADVAREMLYEEKKKLMDALKNVQDLSAQLAAAQDEIQFLKKKREDDPTARHNAQVEKFTAVIAEQKKIMEQRKDEIQTLETRLADQTELTESKEQNIEYLKGLIERLQQNQKILQNQVRRQDAFQKSLVKKLQASYQENLQILKQNSELTFQNEMLTAKGQDEVEE